MKTKDLVEEVLKKQNVTPYRLAKEMGVENPTVYRWKNGQREANGQHLMELLRRAGRLAAAVLLGFGMWGAAAPEEANAVSQVKADRLTLQSELFNSVYYVKLSRRIPKPAKL